MTGQQINATIAEVLRHNSGADEDAPDGHWTPDYCNDLDACHEMEKSLTGQQYHAGYKQTLSSLLGSEGDIRVPSAGARARAEAFLRTIGKWKSGG